ncbi:hypothetical protein TNCV_1598021 [Trichonephila clavipes]|nr:hypothetical protein TNCV_1598021 [Trichonephila clavipes]
MRCSSGDVSDEYQENMKRPTRLPIQHLPHSENRDCQVSEQSRKAPAHMPCASRDISEEYHEDTSAWLQLCTTECRVQCIANRWRQEQFTEKPQEPKISPSGAEHRKTPEEIIESIQKVPPNLEAKSDGLASFRR